jgi:Heavy metal associated domain 2/E1-E2 ATPase
MSDSKFWIQAEIRIWRPFESKRKAGVEKDRETPFMEFSIRHFISGRIRLFLPSLCRKKIVAEAALAWLQTQPGVKKARLNYACASLVIEYDAKFEAVLRATLGRLSVMSVDELQKHIDPGNAPRAAARTAVELRPAKSPAMWRNSPLALPTLSLLLAFSANPVLRAINAPLMLWNGYPIALRAWRVWRREGRLNIDFLDALAITASLLQGNPMAGAIVTWLIKLGDWIRDLTAAGQRRAMSELLEFQAKTAWVVRDGAVTSIPASQLAIGDEVIAYPGEMIPVDGENYRRPRDDRSEIHHRRRIARDAGQRRAGIRRDCHPRWPAHHPRHPGRYRDNSRPDRRIGRVCSDRRHADAESCRKAR